MFTETIDQMDQREALEELLISFDDLIQGKKTSLRGLDHLALHMDRNAPPHESTHVFVMKNDPLTQLRLTRNRRPDSPIDGKLTKKELSIEAPKGRVLDLQKCGLPQDFLSYYAMKELGNDLRFERVVLTNLDTHPDPNTPIADYGFTLRGKRSFAPEFAWNGFSALHTTFCPDSQFIHPQDKDTLKLRSTLLQLSREIVARFRQGTSVSEFLGNHPRP